MKNHHVAENRQPSIKNQRLHLKLQSVFLVVTVFIVLSCGYLRFSWNSHKQAAANEAIVLVRSLEAMLHPEHISELSGSDDDLGKEAYKMEKTDLMRLVQATSQISYAYILGQRKDDIIILVDSAAPESAHHAPPGQVYEEAAPVYREPFRNGQTVLTEPVTNRRGTWISALEPVKDPLNGQVLAVFGLDYPADAWQARLYRHMIPDLIIVISLFLFLAAYLYALLQKAALKNLSKDLSYNEALYHSIFSQAPIGVALVKEYHFVQETRNGYASINPMFETILGRSKAELEEISWTEITHPDDLQADLDQFERFKAGDIEGYTMEKRFIKPDQAVVWTDMHISRLRGLPDHPDMHLCLIEDITAFKEGEQRLIESERSKSVLLSNLPGMAYRCLNDQTWTMQFVSEGCRELTGYAPESLLGNRDLPFSDVIKPQYRALLRQAWKKTVTGKARFSYEYEITTATGETKWVFEQGEGIYNDKGVAEALEGLILDITDRKAAEQQLRYAAEHDSWTGLLNWKSLENRLLQDAEQPLTDKRALIGINLNTMYLLSLSYGFSYSQAVLKNVANALCVFMNDQRQLFSSYEYRFVFYIKGYQNKDELEAFCATVAKTLTELLAAERIGGGIGILEIDEANRRDVDHIMKNTLLTTEKSIEKSMKSEDPELRILFFDQAMATGIDREEKINRELVQIAASTGSDRLFLQYQPILDLKKNRICSFEALARLNSNHFGFVPPNEFIPIAEKSKLIVPLGDVIIFQALQFLIKLAAEGYPDIGVSINISAVQLLRTDFTQNLIDKVRRWQINPANVGLELTESIFAANYDDINRVIRELRAMGMIVAIDDFGTGYSSLARERDICADCLKIDKHFIDNLLESDPDVAITSDIIAMGHKLGRCVIAEGVEYASQLQYLKAHGCDKVQGYLISRPLHEDRAIAFLSQYRQETDS